MAFSLHTQISPPCAPATKIRLSMLAKAMVDALGGPAEFSRRFSFEEVRTMIPNENFGLPPGVWTDDTSMALCLGQSLVEKQGFDEEHQLELYMRWRGKGYLSATGVCFDVGNTISTALFIYANSGSDAKAAIKSIAKDLGRDAFSGNGSLMRVLPVGLVYWQDEELAKTYGARSSITTHPNALCQEVCEVWCGAISRIMQNPGMSKLDLLDYFARFPYKVSTLKEKLGIPSSAPKIQNPTASAEEKEAYYWAYHPLLQTIAANKDSEGLPSEAALPSSGYVLHTVVAALYAFFSTSTFEEGAIFAVNLGSDADTVGAIYGGLAGCWYAVEETSDEAASGLFWTDLVKNWRDDLVKKEMIEEVAEGLVALAEGFAKK